MLQLHTLGGFSASDASGANLTLPRHRWALLAMVAAAGERGIPRDKVLACLWPEVPDEKARARLQQMMHAIRASLGAQFFHPGDPLRMNGDVVSSDVEEFQRAADDGDLRRAAALYRGVFLDGFHFGDTPEFDEWLERERSRLSAKCALVLERLAIEASTRQDHVAAVEWWRALAAADPLSSRAARRLMEALAAAGDRTGALQHAAVHTAHVRNELGLDPDPIVRAFADTLSDQAQPAALEALTATTLADTPAARSFRNIGPVDAPTLVAEPGVAPAKASGSRRVHRRRVVAAGGLSLLAAAGVWGGVARSRSSLVENRVAVVPFENRTGDARLDAFGALVSDMVTEGLIRTEVGEAVPLTVLLELVRGRPDRDRARDVARTVAVETRASLVILGNYYQSGDSLIVNAQIVGGSTGRLIQPLATIVGPARDLLGLATTVQNRALGAIAARLTRPFPDDWTYADYGVRQPSYDAYSEFAAGLRLFAESDYAGAATRFERAIDRDSLFAQARLLAARARMYTDEPATADSLLRFPMGAALAEPFQYQADYLRALLRGDTQSALRNSRKIMTRLPAAGGEFAVGYAALAANRPRETVALFDSLQPLRGMQREWAAFYNNYLTALEELGENQRALDIARTTRRSMPERPQPIVWEGLALASLGRVGEAEARVEEIWKSPRSAERKANGIRRIAERLLGQGHVDAARRSFERGAQLLKRSTEPPSREARVQYALYLLRLGWPDSAGVMLEQVHKEWPDLVDVHGFVGIAAAERGDRATADRITRELVSMDRRYVNGANLFLAAKIAAALGDRQRAVTLLQEGLERGYPFAFYPRTDVIPVAFPSRFDLDFRNLRGYAPFEELLRPRS